MAAESEKCGGDPSKGGMTLFYKFAWSGVGHSGTVGRRKGSVNADGGILADGQWTDDEENPQ